MELLPNREINGAATTDVDNFVFYITLKTVQTGKKQPVHGKITSFSLFFVICT